MAWGLMMMSGIIPEAVWGMSSGLRIMPIVPFCVSTSLDEAFAPHVIAIYRSWTINTLSGGTGLYLKIHCISPQQTPQPYSLCTFNHLLPKEEG
jgi:hypothetical protein